MLARHHVHVVQVGRHTIVDRSLFLFAELQVVELNLRRAILSVERRMLARAEAIELGDHVLTV